MNNQQNQMNYQDQGSQGISNFSNNQSNNQTNMQNTQTIQTMNNAMTPGMRVQSGMSTKMSGGKKLSKAAISNPRYTENWLNLKTIKNNIIYTKDGYMVTGVKIQPKNIFILEQFQADNIIFGLMNFYNTIDFEFWLMIADRPVDISMYQAEMQILFNKTNDPRLRKIIAQDMNKGDIFVNNQVSDIEYYILFKEKKLDILQKKLRNLINGISSCDLTCSQTSDDDLRTILDNLLNGGRKYEAGSVII